ncbi:MAG: hypothetical protein H0W42_12205 [Gemmatimonadaceae bacterium]|nr:hypothetical protein [Gemmatimonadaceae bacterium]
MASQHPRLVALYQTTAAHGRQMAFIAERDGHGLRWRLSRNHPGHVPCVVNDERDMGFGRGIYRTADFPTIPQHPRCRCYSESVPLVAS